MNAIDLGLLILYVVVLLALVKPLGLYMARVYEGQPSGINWLFAPVERFTYRCCGILPDVEMGWRRYLLAMLLCNLFGLLAVYALQRFQAYLPLNPQSFPNVPPDLAFNTASSFATNTNWQSYAGESTLSYLTQMMALTVQNFISAATGMSLLMALIRGIVRHDSEKLGNFWVDTFRGIFYILLPLSLLFSLFLVSQGVIQNFKAYQTVTLLQPVNYQQSSSLGKAPAQLVSQVATKQVIPMGPVASQVAIKQLGTNGGGFFNTNAAHPFENPTPFSNFLEMLAILLIPAALCATYGQMVGDKRQGWAILLVMMLIFVPLTCMTIAAEHQNPAEFTRLGIAPTGNMEGKEARLGIVNSAMWATATTAASNGSVNSMHDSFTPLGVLSPILLMHFGEVIFGGVGSGLYGMLMVVIVTVFVAGLMIGRTPEYLGKKIEPYEMKMATVAVLVMPLGVLICTAISSVIPMGVSSIANPGAHGFSEILYAWTSMGNNNGTAMAGLNANTPYYNTLGGLVMLFSRYWIAIPTLAIAGSLVKKKKIPTSAGTLMTHTPLFVFLLLSVAIILGALSFLPALALGPIVEQLMTWR
jgi:K+-transporting ATPase ATPase A chain